MDRAGLLHAKNVVFMVNNDDVVQKISIAGNAPDIFLPVKISKFI